MLTELEKLTVIGTALWMAGIVYPGDGVFGISLLFAIFLAIFLAVTVVLIKNNRFPGP